MKKTLFIMTHVGSSWQALASAIEADLRFQVFETGHSYDHPDDLKVLTSKVHRLDNRKAVWCDVVTHNQQFTMRLLCPYYHFIFWSVPFVEAWPALEKAGYSKPQAKSYWNYRMEGLRQYHARSPQSLWNPDLKRDLVLNALLV